MQTTTHYGFNIVEGTDIVNPLTQLNPNFTTLDTELYDVSLETIGNATEVVSGGVHAITRSDATKTTFKFVATGDFMEGNTFSVDGVAVTAKTLSGANVPGGAYVTGSIVIASLNGNNLTVYASDVEDVTADDVSVSGGGSVQDYIDNLGEKNLEVWEPVTNETWESLIGRIRDGSVKTIPANVIRTSIDGISGLIFHQDRRTGSTLWQYNSHYTSGGVVILYSISASPTSVAVRKYNLIAGTVENLTTQAASQVAIYGLDV